MKNTTIKVLRGRLETAIAAYEANIKKEYDDARSARMKRNRVLVEDVKRDLTTALTNRFSRYVDVHVEGPGSYSNCMTVGLRTNEKFQLLTKQVKKSHGFEDDKSTERKVLVCHSLGVMDDHRRHSYGVHVETYDFFQPLLTRIDNEFVKSDGAEISALIESFIGKSK